MSFICINIHYFADFAAANRVLSPNFILMENDYKVMYRLFVNIFVLKSGRDYVIKTLICALESTQFAVTRYFNFNRLSTNYGIHFIRTCFYFCFGCFCPHSFKCCIHSYFPLQKFELNASFGPMLI